MKIILAFALFGFLCISKTDAALAKPLASTRATEVLSKMISNGYDKRFRPDSKVTVDISAYLIRQYDYNEKDSTFAVDMYFRQLWNDPRLASSNMHSTDLLLGGKDVSDLIWKPDTFTAIDTTARRANGMTENVFTRIHANGSVFYSCRYTMRAQCSQDNSKFPRDVHNCHIDFESYGYNTEVIEYRWLRKPNAVSYDKVYTLPDFTILEFKTGSEQEELSSGTYSRLLLKWTIARNSHAYILRDLIPSTLATLMSFVPLWMSKKHPHIRILVGTVLLAANLILITPAIVTGRSGTINAADCYRMTNLVFVGIGYLLLSWLSIQSGRETIGDFEKVQVVSQQSQLLSRINRMGRMGLIGIYVIFNCVYWFSFAL